MTSAGLDDAEPLPGSTLDGRYVLEARLGHGTSGVVYRVRHRDTGRPLALKLLNASMDEAERFRREAQTLGLLQHPNIVSVTDFGTAPEASGRPYLVTELLEGETLRTLLAEPMDRKRTLDWLAAIADALDHAHARGVLHRDLKPENVIVCQAPGRPAVPMVVDFGLAGWWRPRADQHDRDRPDDPRLTGAGQLAGTPMYAAPEQIRGDALGPAADVYALGVLAYEMLAGRPPFQGAVLDVLDAHLLDPPVRPEGLPDELWSALRAALAKEPGQRPPSASAFVTSLRQADDLVRGRPEAAAAHRRRARLGAAGAALTLAGAWYLGDAGWARQLERRTQDWRWGLVPSRAADARLLLVPIDEQSLARDPRPLAEWGDAFGTLGTRALRAGAAGVAFDLLLPARVGEAPAFAELVNAQAGRLLLAVAASEDGSVTGSEVLDPATLASFGSSAPFGLVNITSDADGVCRGGSLVFHDTAGGDVPAFAARAAQLLGAPAARHEGERFVLQGDLARSSLERLPWHEAVSLAESAPERLRGRLLVIGAEYVGSGDEQHAAALRGERVLLSGLELQALQAASLLAPQPARLQPARGLLLTAGVLAALLAGLGLALGSPGRALLVLLAVALLQVAFVARAFVAERRILPLVAPLGGPALAAGALAAAVLASRRTP